MKVISPVAALFVAALVIGCSNNSNPLQSDSTLSNGGVFADGSQALAAASGQDRARQNEIRIEGKIAAVDVQAKSITIGTTVVYANEGTKIERNGQHVPLSAIQVGERGQARIPVGGKYASKVESAG